MKIKLPVHIPGILNKVPEQDQPKGDEEAKFWRIVAYELSQLINYAFQAKDPEVVFNDFRKASDQYIWEFYVNDLAKPRTDLINWHGQNTSQWVYAGCILLQNGIVSTHH